MIANICFEFGTFGARFIWLAFAACTFPSGDHDGVMAFASYHTTAAPRLVLLVERAGEAQHIICVILRVTLIEALRGRTASNLGQR